MNYSEVERLRRMRERSVTRAMGKIVGAESMLAFWTVRLLSALERDDSVNVNRYRALVAAASGARAEAIGHAQACRAALFTVEEWTD